MVFGDQLGHDAYLDFLARAVDAQTKLIYSELLDLELAQVCVKAARGRHDGRRQASIRTGKQLIRDVFERWNILISPTQRIESLWQAETGLTKSGRPSAPRPST